MADKTTKSNRTNATVRKPEENDRSIKENETEKVLLHPFFVSAIKNIYHTEHEDEGMTDTVSRSVHFDKKQRD